MFNKKLSCILIAIVLLLASLSACAKNDSFTSWNDNDSLDALVAYVEDVTNEKSPNYIPVEDRIAMFDMDGTLYCETDPCYIEILLLLERCFNDPSFTPSPELAAFAEDLKSYKESDSFLFTEMNVMAFEGMSLDEYYQFVKDYTQNTDAPGFDGLKYSDLWFAPMLEIVDYLSANDFSVWICSGTDRATCRALADGHVNIPSQNIIGCDILYKGSNQGDVSGLEYEMDPDEIVVRGDESRNANIKFEKVESITTALGKQPVLAFGNSSGDISMLLYTTCNNKYKSAGFMVLADDEVRNYGDEAKAAEKKALWDSYGWYSFSMKNDFKTIYKQ